MDHEDYFNNYLASVNSSRSIIRSIMTLLERQDDILRDLYYDQTMRHENTHYNPAPIRRRTGLGTHSPIFRQAMRNNAQSPLSGGFYREDNTNRNNVHTQFQSRNINTANTNTHTNTHTNTNTNTNTNTRNPPIIRTNRENTLAELFTQAIINGMSNYGNLSPVVVRPSREIIESSTENIMFSDIPSSIDRYQQCPISHESFNSDTPITRIRQCGHYFERESIATWFQTSCRCPICRADIRDGVNLHSDFDDADDDADDVNDTDDADDADHHDNADEEAYSSTNSSNSESTDAHGRNMSDILALMTSGMDRDTGSTISYQFEILPVIRNSDAASPSNNQMTYRARNYGTTRSPDSSGNLFSQ